MQTPQRVGQGSAATGPQPFVAFYHQNVERVTALAVALAGRRDAAEELAQEAFTRAYRDWGRVGSYDEPAAWVRRVTINLSHSRWRKLKREAIANARSHAAVSPHLELTGSSAELWQAVRRLPRRQAATVALHYIDDLPVADIAQLLGVAEGTTKSDLHRARTQLAKGLQQEQR